MRKKQAAMCNRYGTELEPNCNGFPTDYPAITALLASAKYHLRSVTSR